MFPALLSKQPDFFYSFPSFLPPQRPLHLRAAPASEAPRRRRVETAHDDGRDGGAAGRQGQEERAGRQGHQEEQPQRKGQRMSIQLNDLKLRVILLFKIALMVRLASLILLLPLCRPVIRLISPHASSSLRINWD